MLEEYRTIALRVERALAALPGEAVLRDPDGKPLISLPSPTASEQAPGPVTVAQVYELASAVLYANLERKGKG